MSREKPLHARLRTTRFEHVEERLLLSATPWPALVHHTADVTPALEVGGGLTSDDVTGSIAITPHLNNAHSATGVANVHADYGFYGAGQTVVVIDSGIAYDHVALGGGFGSNSRVVGGWDFAENDSNPYDDAPAGFHGTHVAGIIGSDDATHTGVASQVDLVALRVFDDSGNGNFDWVEQALDWVIANQNTFENPITTVNLSLGVPSMNESDVPWWAQTPGGLESKFQALDEAGIFIAVSAGNDFEDFNAKGLSYPAVSDWVVPVSSANDAGTSMSDFSQRADHVLVAPGESIVSTVPDELFSFDGNPNDWAAASGTSMASPYVAGASVLVREAYAFMGIDDVDQDMIYDVLFDTASIINDPITGGNYRFINVEAALDVVVTDSLGDSAANATAMGMMGDGYSFSEQIGKLNDRDYFSFTAEESGQMTLTAAATHDLTTSWQLVGQGPNVVGDSLAFDVVAGQTYTVGLMSSEGIGRYSIDVELVQTAVELGTVERTTVEDVTLTAEQWYNLAATRTGVLTVETIVGNSESASVELYDADNQLVGTVSASAGYSRLNADVVAGEQLRLRLSGSSANASLEIWNIVGVVGDRADVYGTSENDAFSVFAGETHQVTVNGLSYSLASADFSSVRLLGQGGDDSVRIYGSSEAETAVLRVGTTSLTGESHQIVASNFEDVFVNGRGGEDRAIYYDSSGDDRFIGKSDFALLDGEGFSHIVRGFEDVLAMANEGGNDRAIFYDSIGNDRFLARPDYSLLEGDGFYNFASGFDNVVALATAGGDDQAVFYDSVGDDRFIAKTANAFMDGDSFYNYASGFGKYLAISNAGGSDSAVLYDSLGNDQFVARPDNALLHGESFYSYVRGFSSVSAIASEGTDKAIFFDSAGDDRFIGRPDYSMLDGAGFSNLARGFDTVNAIASAGGSDLAILFGSSGNDRFLGHREFSCLDGDGFMNVAKGFETARAIGNSGGNDRATFYDAVAGDLLNAAGQGADLQRSDARQFVFGFGNVRANTQAGESANLEISTVDYVFEAVGNWN